MSKFYNVVSTKTISNSVTNSDKKIYHKIGVVKVTESGGWYLQLYQQPNDSFQIFPNQDDELPVIEFENHEA